MVVATSKNGAQGLTNIANIFANPNLTSPRKIDRMKRSRRRRSWLTWSRGTQRPWRRPSATSSSSRTRSWWRTSRWRPEKWSPRCPRRLPCPPRHRRAKKKISLSLNPGEVFFSISTIRDIKLKAIFSDPTGTCLSDRRIYQLHKVVGIGWLMGYGSLIQLLSYYAIV